MESGIFEMAITGTLTKKLVENLGKGRHGDGGGLYLVVDPSGARRWIVRVVVKGQKNKKGAPLRTDFGLWRGCCDIKPSSRTCVGISAYGKAGFEPAFQCPA